MVLWGIGQSFNRLQLRGQTLDPSGQIRSNRSTGSSSEQRGNARDAMARAYIERSELFPSPPSRYLEPKCSGVQAPLCATQRPRSMPVWNHQTRDIACEWKTT
eukprot:5054351-Alexandrium_andersonii.AAC.1